MIKPVLGSILMVAILVAPVSAASEAEKKLDTLLQVLKTTTADLAAFKKDLSTLKTENAALNKRLNKMPSVPGGQFPKDAVVAFDISDSSPCPNGWHSFKSARARVIVGAGDPKVAPGERSRDKFGRPLTHYLRGNHGGEEIHALITSEIPLHGHDIGSLKVESSGDFMHKTKDAVTLGGNTKFPVFGAVHGNNFGKHFHPLTGELRKTGGNKPHNNMPPYIALYYCKKD